MKYVNLNKNRFGKKKRKFPERKHLLLLGLLLVLVFLVRGSLFSLKSLLTPVSVFSQIINPSSLEQTDGRTNILALGVDKRSNVGFTSGVLTDTIMAASIDGKKKDAALISIPRDLWVKLDQNTYGKINSAYAFSGVELAKSAAEKVLGVPIHYFVVVDFESFEKAIDILGGIEVNVERAFDDYKFPKIGFENAEPEEARWEYLHFDAGLQHMDGKTALAFARSRHAEGPEGSDFARIKRQQKIALAVKDKALSLKTLTDPKKLKELYDLFSASIETNIGLSEVEKLYQLSQGFENGQIRSYLIDGSWDSKEALLYTPEAEAYGGAFVLIPKAGEGNFSEIHYFVQKLLFGSN